MLINCVAYPDGKRIGEIDPHEIHEYVGRRDCFVWVALRDATEAELAEMQEEFDLHPLAVEDANHGHQRPKVEEYGNSIFGRWWPRVASSTASSCSPNSSCICTSSAGSGSFNATHTKQSGRFTYSLMSSIEISARRLPSG